MLLLGSVSVDFGNFLPVPNKVSLLDIDPQVKEKKNAIYIHAVTRSFFQVLIVVFPTCAQQTQPNDIHSYENCCLYLNYSRILH